MFGYNYYHGTLRRYVMMFGNLFNEIQIGRFDGSGNRIQVVNVPISYGPKQKFIERALADPTGLKSVSTVVPRLAFAMTSMTYAPIRKLNSTLKYQNIVSENGTGSSVFAPVPYDMNFTLSILTRNAEDGTQILEQIVPFFTPDFTVTMRVLPQMDVNIDVPIEIVSISSDDQYEGDFDTRRVLTWDIDFTVKGYLFGPVKTSTKGARIDEVKVNVFDGFDATIPEFTIIKPEQQSQSPTIIYTTDSLFSTTDSSTITTDIQ
jgi:hypothetical protein